MKMSIKILALVFTSIWICAPMMSQIVPVSEQQVKGELEKRGISEEEMLNALAEKGIVVDDLADLTPSQILELEAVVQELEAKNQDVPETVAEKMKKEEFLETKSTAEVEKLKESLEEIADVKVEEGKVNIYGHDFFKNKDLSTFEKSTDVKAPPSYILSSGDKLVVSIWGLSQNEFNFEIDEEGYIYSNNQRIFLKGLMLKDAKIKLESRFNRSYRFNKGEFDVALSASRTINVNVQGEVANPGGYTISAVNNAFNLLIAAQGPTRIGSLRDIMLIKKSGEIKNLDFYSYLSNPSDISNAALEEGDIIVVPVAKKLVRVAQGLKRPMIYELKNSERLSDLVNLAGGYANGARRDIIQVERFSASGKILADVPSSNFRSYDLKDGDVIKIAIVDEEVENFVEVKGATVNTGVLERTEGMTVGDLLRISQLKSTARKDLAFIKRTEIDGKIVYIDISIEESSSDLSSVLKDKDVLTIFNRAQFTDNQSFKVGGAVRVPGSFGFALEESITIKDAITIAGGLRRDASGFGIIHTKDPLNPKVKKYKRVNLAEAFENKNEYVISALDSLEIFSNELFDEASQVTITGAINGPGGYQYGEGMTLGDVLTMSGGFKLAAATNRIEISRLQIEDNQPTKVIIANLEVDRDIMTNGSNLEFELKPYDEIMVRYIPEFELQKIVNISGEVKFPGEYSLIKDNETIKDVIMRAGGVTAEAFPPAAKLYRAADSLGFIILKLDEVLESNSSRFNYSLKNGDRIEIPKARDFVSIVGATNAKDLYNTDIIGEQNKLNVPFHPGKDAKFYIEHYAGGIAENGSTKEVFVESPNGEVVRTKNYFVYKNYPEVPEGSTIVVGSKPPITDSEKEREDVDWTKVLQDTVAQAVSVLTLILLIERL